MNEDQMAGLWDQFIGAAQERCGALVGDPALEAAGRHMRLAGAIRARLGSSQALAARQLDDFLHRHRHWDIP